MFAAFQSNASRNPERVLVQKPGGASLTYGAALGQAEAYSSALTAAGVRPGDRVAVQTDKSVEAVLVYLACLRNGFVFLPMNPAYQEAETLYILNDSEAALFICRPDLVSRAEAAGVQTMTLAADGCGTLADAASCADAVAPVAGSFDDDIAAILYTSGTTGRPKGAMLTRANLVSNARVLAQEWGITSADKLIHVLPVFHAHGLFVAINTTLVSGATMIWFDRFDPRQVIEFIPLATTMMAVPTMYARLLDAPGFAETVRQAEMRLFISGSAPLTAQDWERFKDATGHEILERYGMTEILMHTSNPLLGQRKPGSVGPPLPGGSLRIVEGGAEIAPGEIGNIEVKGPNVFKGYWRNPEKTAAEFTPDGWFQTGDLGHVDSDGYLTISGRAKDLIISGGYNVYPKEVEAEIDRVEGVIESAVFGVPHPDFGEGVTAVIVGEEDTSLPAKVEAGLAKRLAAYKRPKRIVFLDALPRNAMGKVQKNELRKTYHDLYSIGKDA